MISLLRNRCVISFIGATLLTFLPPVTNACTTAVISGRATSDGRPILWKNRDAPHLHNEVVLLEDGKYRVVAVVNAGSRNSVWMGVNSAGLCIENSLSKDLKTDDKVDGPGNGQFMKQVLLSCATIKDVVELLEASNKTGRKTQANFGVIDAEGGAAIIETGPNSYALFDANDPKVAPHGYLIRANFSTTAQSVSGAPSPNDVQGIYSSQRYLHACRRLEEQSPSQIDVEYVLRNLARDLSDEQGDPYSGTVNGDRDRMPLTIDTNRTISRATTVSAVVFHGVRQGEAPQLTTMWTVLGDPKFSIAVPCWADMSAVADPMEGKHGAEIGEVALTLRGWSLERDGTSVATNVLPGIWKDLWPTEDGFIERTLNALEQWRTEGVNPAQLTALHQDLALTAMRAMQQELAEMKQTVLSTTMSNQQTLQSLGWLPATERRLKDIAVGLYDGTGVGASQAKLLSALRQMDDVYVTYLSAEDIRAGKLADIDLLIHPGGSGGKQGRALGEDGRTAVRDYVRNGGGFIGFCAGAYLASNHYSWSLNLLDAKVFDRVHWARGTGLVQMDLLNEGRTLLKSNDETVRIFYGQGPLLVPGQSDDIPDYVSLAAYSTGIATKGAPSNVMQGTTAIAAGNYGDGRVLCFSPHPELTDGLDSFVHQAVRHVAKKKLDAPLQKPKNKPPSGVMIRADQTPDISQKHLKNGSYCAPCAVGNLLYQFDRRGLIELPERFTVATTDEDFLLRGRDLATQLGSNDFMQTVKHNGTNRYRLVNGFNRFLRDECQVKMNAKYLGIRPYDESKLNELVRPCTQATVGVPKLVHLQKELAEDRGVIILFGSYSEDFETGRLERVGGHYVAAVGYGRNAAGEDDAASIALHDSNDSHTGAKFVRAQSVDRKIELWEKRNRLVTSDDLVELVNAPITQDGRVAYLETIFSFEVRSN